MLSSGLVGCHSVVEMEREVYILVQAPELEGFTV